MLRHDDTPETSATPAALVRVTPQELAAALARLEARRGGLDGTIPLGDAVQELGLNVTPEELLREIEVSRASQYTHPPRTSMSQPLRVGLGSLAGGCLLLGGLFTLRSAAPVPSPPAAMTAPAAPQAAPVGIPATLLVRQPDGKMALLSEVADGQPVLGDILATDTGATLADFAPDDGHWTLIKHSGQVYVRGWIGDMSDAALRSTVVSIHRVRQDVSASLHPVPVTLPLGGFQSPQGLTWNEGTSASHVIPDEHLKEKW